MPGTSESRPRLLRNWLSTLRTMKLSSREIDVLRRIAAGSSNRQIADKLSIGETTVKSHIRSILSKLGAERIGPML